MHKGIILLYHSSSFNKNVEELKMEFKIFLIFTTNIFYSTIYTWRSILNGYYVTEFKLTSCHFAAYFQHWYRLLAAVRGSIIAVTS